MSCGAQGRAEPVRALGVGTLLVAVLVGLALVDDETGLGVWVGLRDDLARTHERVALLEVQNDALRREIELLESDPGAIDRVIREQLGLVRPGEQIVRFVAPTDGDPRIESARTR